MARTKSEFVGAFGTAFEVFKGLSDEVLSLGGDDDDLRRVLREPRLRRSIAEIIIDRKTEAFPVTVNYDLPLTEMIAAGRYDLVNGDITARHFPVKGNGSEEREIRLVNFGRWISSDDAIRGLDRQELRPAKIEELLAFGATYPDKQRKLSIVALGSVWRKPDGGRSVPFLWRVGVGRCLGLDWLGGIWGDLCRFAAVSK